mgnify:CR=1 FL=1
MKGIHRIEVSNRDAKFKFELVRNITVVRGKSGTGKTTLFEMVADHTRLGKNSGVNISCDKKCYSLIDIDWQNQLGKIRDGIVFIDEGAEYIKTKEFAELIKQTDNYYVIFNRESLHELPYSVDEIYEIKTSGKYHSFKKMYTADKKHIYGKSVGTFDYSVFLTEDSGAGFRFYREFFQRNGVECVSSFSNGAIFKWLNTNKDKKVFVVADGAAFGAEIDRVLKLQSASGFRLCLPESFEWLILRSGLIKRDDITAVLQNPADYIESANYFSWERFFENYLKQSTVNTPFHYVKNELNPVYLIHANAEKIISEISDIE